MLFLVIVDLSVPNRYTSNLKVVCTTKIISATNHPLLIKGKDKAFWERVVTIPFAFSVPPELKINGLDKLLLKEKDGIVAKAMAAYFRLVDNQYRFAGDFKPNEVIASADTSEANCELQIFRFVKSNFTANENGVVFIEDAFKLFNKLVGGIYKNEFSHYFQKYALEILGGEKDRKRKHSRGNAMSCITGISFVEEEKHDV